MIKKPLGLSPEEQIRAYHKTRMHRALIGPPENPVVRAAAVDASLLLQQMRANHELGILETLILGQAYMGALLMTSQLKGQDSISLSIQCEGPVSGLHVEANAYGEVRGYLKNKNIEVLKPVDPNEYSEYFGKGNLEITRSLAGGKQPFTSRVEMKYGNIAQDLAYYFTKSEQTPTGFHLSIRFDQKGKLIGGGGLILQVLPGHDSPDAQDLIRRIENQMLLLPSFGSELAQGKAADEYLKFWFEGLGITELGNRPVEFTCHCNQDRFFKNLSLLPQEDREQIKEHGPFPLSLVCHHCNSVYEIPREMLETL